MSGDYEFLSRMYGISGAQGTITHYSYDSLVLCIMYMGILGRHPCLWCNITSEQMKLPREERPAVSPRTLDSLQADLLFQTAGQGNLKQAKNFNNVIGQYFFKIP